MASANWQFEEMLGAVFYLSVGFLFIFVFKRKVVLSNTHFFKLPKRPLKTTAKYESKYLY
jgi:hypothetical protein